MGKSGASGPTIPEHERRARRLGRLHLRISEEIEQKFRAYVDDRGLGLADAAETALCEYLDRHVGK